MAIEWPKSCLYWREKRVLKAMREWGLSSYDLDGCMYGLTSQSPSTQGRPLRKPSSIASNCDTFKHIVKRCTHRPDEHARTQGADTKRTESYTDALADGIHNCWLMCTK